jgi:hypothetical protein
MELAPPPHPEARTFRSPSNAKRKSHKGTMIEVDEVWVSIEIK